MGVKSKPLRNERSVAEVRLAIKERRAVPGRDMPTRRSQHGMTGRRCPIPWSGRRGDRCRLPRRHQAEFQRRTGVGMALDRQGLEQFVGLGIGMRAAAIPRPARRRPARARRWRACPAPGVRRRLRPAAPTNSRPIAGASTTPATGWPSTISPILTVNSPPRLMNSLVPSTGSTRKKARSHLRRCGPPRLPLPPPPARRERRRPVPPGSAFRLPHRHRSPASGRISSAHRTPAS